jgi:hypothetical protein
LLRFLGLADHSLLNLKLDSRAVVIARGMASADARGECKMRSSGSGGIGLAIVAAALVFLVGAGAAQAARVIDIGGTALQILNLELDGEFYNVEFIFDSANNIYGLNPSTSDLDFMSRSDSDAAVVAINDALNQEGDIINVNESSSSLYTIPFVVDGQMMQRSVGFEGGANWVLWPDPSNTLVSNLGSYAKFTVVPEPGTALLMGLGLAGLGAAGGRSRREERKATA